MPNHKATETATIVVPSNPDEDNINLATYAEAAQLPTYAAPLQPSYNYPLIQYGKKVNVVSGTKPRTYTGWLIAIEQDATLDELLGQEGASQVRVRHLKGTEDTYWQLDSIKGYFLFQAVPTNYSPDAWRGTGVAYVWNEYKGTYNYGSQLQCLFFLKGLLDIGYEKPLIITLSRTVTEYFANRVLRRHEAMIATVIKALKNQGKPADLASYAYWLELIKDAEEITTKNGGTYFPPVTTLPSPLTVGYVRQHEALPKHVAIIETFLPVLSQWAEAASMRLIQPPRQNNGNGGTVTQEPDGAAEEE